MIALSSLPTLALLLVGDISGQNTMTFGVGDEILDASRPISKTGLYFEFEVGNALTRSIEALTTFDFGLPEAGRDTDGNSKSLFLGKLYENLRWSAISFSDAFKIYVDAGGGVYIARHKQTRLPDQGLNYGAAICGGTGFNYFPFVQRKFMWSDMFIQLRGQYWHYFGSEYLVKGLSMMIGFGGTF